MSLTLQAGCVAVGGQGVLITGAPGRGKSSLALRLISLGADLVADDGLMLRRDGDRLLASAPGATLGLIEARGAGLLRLAARAEAVLALHVDLDAAAAQRLPVPVLSRFLGLPLRRMAGQGVAELAATLHILLSGRAVWEETGP